MRSALLLLFIVFGIHCLQAQDSLNNIGDHTHQSEVEFRSFDQQKWEQLTKDIKFEKPEKKKKEEPAVNTGINWNFGSLNLGAVKNVLFVCAIALLLFFVIRLLRSQFLTKDKKIKAEVSALDMEDDLEHQDLQAFLNKALDSKNYKQALRIYYLIIVQDLSRKGWIKWEKDKTNSRYVDEMKNRSGANQFREITHQFNFLWYGDNLVDERLFQKEYPKFQKFIDLIKREV